MEMLIKLLPNLIRLSSNNEEVCEKASFIAWQFAVGSPLIQVTVPKRLVKKNLSVAVLDETWKGELEKLSSQLLFQINNILGTPLVTSFEFYVDSKEVNSKLSKAKNIEVEDIKIDPIIEKSAQKITDDDLRKQFIATASKCLAARENKNQQKK